MPEPAAEPLTGSATDVAERTTPPPGTTVPAPPDGAEAPAEVEVAPARRLGFFGWLSALWLTGIVLVALLAPILPLRDPDRSFAELARRGVFTSGAILGGDENGRDMLSRVIFGAGWSLLIAVSAVLLGLFIGGLLGLLAGYFRGWVDTVLSPLFNIMLAIPGLVLILALFAVYASEGASNARKAVVLIIGITITSVPILGRISRASALSWSEREFVRASAVLGARHRRIILREVLPNALPAMASITLLGIAVAIVLEGSLAILGASVTDVPTWGNMIAGGQAQLSRAPHIVMVPSIAIFLTVLSLNHLGDVIRARFDVRESLL